MDRIRLEKFQARAETLMRSYYEALLKGRDEFRAEFPDLAVEVLWSRTGINIRNANAEPEASAQIKLDNAERTLDFFLPKYAGRKHLVVPIVIGDDGEAKLAVVKPPPLDVVASYLLIPVCFPDSVKEHGGRAVQPGLAPTLRLRCRTCRVGSAKSDATQQSERKTSIYLQ